MAPLPHRHGGTAPPTAPASPPPAARPQAVATPAAAQPPVAVAEGPELQRLLAGVLDRQARYEECLSVSGTAPGRTVLFDKHGEAGPGHRDRQVRWVAPHVREEFQQFGSQQAGAGGLEEELQGLASRLSSLRYLRSATGLGRQPTPAILHALMVDCILEQPNPAVRLITARYLHRFLFFQLGRPEVAGGGGRDHWQRLVLSACRSVGHREQLETFELESQQDVAQCAAFLTELLGRCEVPGPGAAGPHLLLAFLVRLLQRDLELWWRSARREGVFLPLLHHMLGGARMEAALGGVVRLYRDLLTTEQELGPARRLLALCAQLAAHSDTRAGQAGCGQAGAKARLAARVAAALAGLQGRDLAIELALLQPPWLAWLVSQALVGLRDSKSESLGALLATSPGAGEAREALAYRLVSCRHLHTLHSVAWQLQQGAAGLSLWRGLDRLPAEGRPVGRGGVRWKSGVEVGRTVLLLDINLVLAAAGGQEEVNREEGSGIRALLFKKSSPTDY